MIIGMSAWDRVPKSGGGLDTGRGLERLGSAHGVCCRCVPLGGLGADVAIANFGAAVGSAYRKMHII